MQDKHKVTLYLPPDLHRQLKIRSAVELEPMSAMAERAIEFYLNHSDIVDEVESSHGQVHRVYSCPECMNALVLRDGDVVSLSGTVGVLSENESLSETLRAEANQERANPGQSGEEALVPC